MIDLDATWIVRDQGSDVGPIAAASIIRPGSRIAALAGKLRGLIADTSGNVLPMGAAGLLLLLMLTGAGVDFSRSYMARSRLQSACDAGALAGRKAVSGNGFNDPAKAIANKYFSANFELVKAQAKTGSATYSSPDSGSTVNGTAVARVSTLILRIVGLDSIDLSVNCTATMSVGNSDVTMVLDTTGSMAGSRIAGLKTAMKNFYDTVATATAGSNARIRYAFVPYSSAVNVGDLIYDANPDYLANTVKIQSREPVYTTRDVEHFDHWGDPVYSTAPGGSSTPSYGSWTKYSNTAYSKSKNCTPNLPNNSAWSNEGSPSSTTSTSINQSGQQVKTTTITQDQSATIFQCTKYPDRNYYIESAPVSRQTFSYSYETRDPVTITTTEEVFAGFTYKQVDWNVASYKAGGALTYLNDSGHEATTTWDGCVEERKTVYASGFSYSNLVGFSPSGALDLEIDAGSEDDTGGQWSPMVSAVAYERGYYRYGRFYPQNVATYPSGAQNGSLFYVCPEKAQLLEVMTQDEFYDYADSLTTGGSTWHDLGAIWGGRISSPDGIFASVVNEEPANGGEVARHMIFMTDGEMNADNLVYSSYGIEFHDKRTTSDGSTNADAIHGSRFKAVCDAIKAKGIRLWVIAFGTSLTSNLTACASSQSAFSAANASELNTQFQEIAKQVGELRITQ